MREHTLRHLEAARQNLIKALESDPDNHSVYHGLIDAVVNRMYEIQPLFPQGFFTDEITLEDVE